MHNSIAVDIQGNTTTKTSLPLKTNPPWHHQLWLTQVQGMRSLHPLPTTIPVLLSYIVECSNISNFLGTNNDAHNVKKCQKAQKVPNFRSLGRKHTSGHACSFLYNAFFTSVEIYIKNEMYQSFSRSSSDKPDIWGISEIKCQGLLCCFGIFDILVCSPHFNDISSQADLH